MFEMEDGMSSGGRRAGRTRRRRGRKQRNTSKSGECSTIITNQLAAIWPTVSYKVSDINSRFVISLSVPIPPAAVCNFVAIPSQAWIWLCVAASQLYRYVNVPLSQSYYLWAVPNGYLSYKMKMYMTGQVCSRGHVVNFFVHTFMHL